MIIRPATLADAAVMQAISQAAGPAAHWGPAVWEAIFSREAPLRRAWLAEEDGGPAGFLVALCDAEWELENVAVLAEFRRRGTARALVTQLLSEARQAGAERLLLEVRASNVAALELYRAMGFHQLGRRRDYYSNPTENALILVHSLAE
jgi:ribosomal-protein-alanine N-acetyltransferase